MLPVHEAARGQTSPYSACTAFALDPVYLALDAMEDFQAAGGLDALAPAEREELSALRGVPAVHWQRVRELKERALDLAFRAFLEQDWKRARRPRPGAGGLRPGPGWLARRLRPLRPRSTTRPAASPGRAGSPRLRDREPAALAAARARHSEDVLRRTWLQWQLDSQWQAARRACAEAGVELMGDLPFMVAGDSADVWARPFDFRLDARVGVPPDQYSAVGQDWGLPVYRWQEMREGGFAWINLRARRTAELYSLFRVDHVVGFYRTYHRQGSPTSEGSFTPPDEPSQTRNGEEMIRIFSQGARVIAEDLGVIPDFVRASLARMGVPGYRVQRWEKNWKAHPPHFTDPTTWPALSLGTTGTHDTEALADWYDALPAEERADLLRLPGLARLAEAPPERFDERVRDALLELVYRSGSDLVLVPFQDAFGSRERVNVPGQVSDANWSYRLPVTLAELGRRPRLHRAPARPRRARRPAHEASLSGAPHPAPPARPHRRRASAQHRDPIEPGCRPLARSPGPCRAALPSQS